MTIPRRTWLHFLAGWLTIGFAGGAVVLLAVATPLEAWLTGNGWSANVTNVLLSLVAIAWVVSAGMIAWRAAMRLATARAFFLYHAVMMVACGLVFNAFVRAGSGLFAGFRGEQKEVTSRFTFGPYPDRAMLEDLKRGGYTGVVTLLSPLVPFEAVLLDEERQNATAVGIELVEASMLPWISANEEALATIRALASRDAGRYYIHCYLGRHRAELANFAIQEATGRRDASALARLPARLMRGPVTRLGETIVLGPAPTREEWFEFLVRAGIRRVLVLGDTTAVPGWASEIHGWAAASAVETGYALVTAESSQDALRALGSGSYPVYVHSFFVDRRLESLVRAVDPEGRLPRVSQPEPDPVGEFLARVDTRPVSLPFQLPDVLERGPITRHTSGRWAFGPLPTEEEWRGAFASSGLRFVISLLDPEQPDDLPWIAGEQGEIERLGADLLVLPARRNSDLVPVLRALRELPGHVYVHAFGADDRLVRLQEMVSGAMPMPDRLERGPVLRVAKDVYAGPLPTPEEWKAPMAAAGLRTVVCLLEEHDPDNVIWVDQVKHAARHAGYRLVWASGIAPGELRARVEAWSAEGVVYIHAYRAEDPRLAALGARALGSR